YQCTFVVRRGSPERELAPAGRASAERASLASPFATRTKPFQTGGASAAGRPPPGRDLPAPCQVLTAPASCATQARRPSNLYARGHSMHTNSPHRGRSTPRFFRDTV